MFKMFGIHGNKSKRKKNEFILFIYSRYLGNISVANCVKQKNNIISKYDKAGNLRINE